MYILYITAEVFAWIGTVTVLVAYLALTRGWLKADSKAFHAANLFGAVTLGIVAFNKGNYQTVTIEVVWGAIAAIGLLRPPKAS